jgi:hypothetical protein
MHTMDGEVKGLIVGLIGALLFYGATALPFAVLTGVSGDVWGGVVFLYGIVVGIVGVFVGVCKFSDCY